jgi:hypothetical protein
MWIAPRIYLIAIRPYPIIMFWIAYWVDKDSNNFFIKVDESKYNLNHCKNNYNNLHQMKGWWNFLLTQDSCLYHNL